tara:strand:- start:228 stop:443 length:216 start_codon:yes stop_codon:yes gene_type:complete
MKSPFIFLRSAFAVAALSTSIFAIDAVTESSDKCWWEGLDSRECGLMLGYSAGAVATTLFFISGATWKFEK